MKVIDYKKFQVSRVVYDKPIKCKGGCLLTKTNYNIDNNQIPIYIQTPKLRTTSGLVISDSRSYIDLELDKNHLGFYEFITNLDENNLTTTHDNSNEWFGQDLPMDVIDDFYNSPLKMSKLERAPSVKFKVPVSKGRPMCEIFGDNTNSIDHNLITKDTEVICILQLVGVKFFKQRFECDWQVIQMRVFLEDYIPKACLIDESLMTDFEKEPEIFAINTDLQEQNDTIIEDNNTLGEINTIIKNNIPVEKNNITEAETNLVDTPIAIEESLDDENSLVVEDLNLGDSDLEEDTEEEDTEEEELTETEIDLGEVDDKEDLEDLEEEISDLDDNLEEIYLDNCESSEESEEDEDDLEDDLEEVELEKGNEVQNLMNEIEELKKLAMQKN